MTAAVQSKLDSAEIAPDGAIQLRLAKVFVDGGGRETPLGFHRTVITPLVNAAAQLDALDAELTAAGSGALPGGDRDVIATLEAALHTDERRAAYAAALAAASAAMPLAAGS